MSLTTRGWGLVVGAIGCGVAGRILGLPQLWIVAVAAGLLIVLAMVMAGRRRGLDVQRRDHLPAVDHGEPIDMHLILHNTGRLPLSRAQVVDTTPPALHSTARATVGHLSARSSVPLAYRATGRVRGRHAFGPLQLVLGDPFGITRRRVRLTGTTRVVVLPRIIPLPSGVSTVSGDVPGDRGVGVARPVGDDVGVVREYVEGDELRRIHWPATAHRGMLMVRQPESRHRHRGVVLLDRTPGRDFELRVTAAASVGQYFHDRGVEVMMVDDPHDPTPAHHPWEVQLERLAAVTAHGGDLRALTATIAGGAAGGGTLVVIATATDRLARTLQRLGRNFDRRTALVTTSGTTAAARARSDLAAARSLGWRTEIVTSTQDLPRAWSSLATRRRTSS